MTAAAAVAAALLGDVVAAGLEFESPAAAAEGAGASDRGSIR